MVDATVVGTSVVSPGAAVVAAAVVPLIYVSTWVISVFTEI